MNEKQLLNLLEKMRKEGKIKSPILSSHINMFLRGEKIEEIYEYISNDVYSNLVILRSIIKQYLKLYRVNDLKISFLKNDDDIIIKLYKAAVLENTEISLKTFIKACDLILTQL